MSNPMIRIHNTETNEVIDREMNAKELVQLEKDRIEFEATAAKLQATIAARTSALTKLSALGLTPEEISAIS
jgi:hypothetical protein